MIVFVFADRETEVNSLTIANTHVLFISFASLTTAVMKLHAAYIFNITNINNKLDTYLVFYSILQ